MFDGCVCLIAPSPGCSSGVRKGVCSSTAALPNCAETTCVSSKALICAAKWSSVNAAAKIARMHKTNEPSMVACRGTGKISAM